MIFDSLFHKIVWKYKVKQISKRFAKGIYPTMDEWNFMAKPYLRQTMKDIKEKCPCEKMLREKENSNGC